MTEQTALAGRMRSYLAELDKVVDRVILLAGKAIKSGDDGYWDGVALNLQSFYSVTEEIFEDIVPPVVEIFPPDLIGTQVF